MCTIDGFLDPEANMPAEEAWGLRQSLDALRAFVNNNKSNIVRDFFVVLACPLESRRGGFPVYLHPKGNGSADQNFVEKLLELTELVRVCRVDVIGLAFDGDAGYLRFARAISTDLSQTSSKQRGTNKHMQIYDMNSLDKGLSLFYSLSVVISDAKPVHLGALGTHWLEHLFGNVRRLCNRNDRPENFQRCLLLTMFKRFVSTHTDGSFHPRKRLSDSGAFLGPEPTPSSARLVLGSLVHEAGCLLKFNLATLPPQLSQCLHFSLRFPTRFQPGMPPILCLFKVPTKRPECGSTTASRMVSVAGLTTRKRDIMATQV